MEIKIHVPAEPYRVGDTDYSTTPHQTQAIDVRFYIVSDLNMDKVEPASFASYLAETLELPQDPAAGTDESYWITMIGPVPEVKL